jgi:YbgC/YbaW family acyl-CoA thioester hydrolase
MQLTPTSFYTIRFGDCDFLGHLNNARYLDYFMNAREDHLKTAYNIQLADYYKSGLGWVVSNHEIHYQRPANYNEQVCIQSSLLKAADDHLHVEMLMLDEQQSHFKSLLWTRFVPINIKTGKRENHPVNFMDFARGIENSELTKTSNSRDRLAEIVSRFKSKQIKV